MLDFLESIWQTAYNTIANCNALISHVEKADPDLFPYAESGEREIPVWAVIKLADYYRVSTDYLLGLTDDPARR